MEVTRSALLLELISKLQSAGSWCGETHIQKTAFFAKCFLGIPLEYEFVLYKYGPYSFELNEELTELRAYNFLKLVPHYPYGASISLESNKNKLREYCSKIDIYNEKLTFIAKKLGPKKVNELERLATVLFIKNNFEYTDDSKVATKLNELKPHVSIDVAFEAINEYNKLENESRIFTNSFEVMPSFSYSNH